MKKNVGFLKVNKKIKGIMSALPPELSPRWLLCISLTILIPFLDLLNTYFIYVIIIVLQGGKSYLLSYYTFDKTNIIGVAVILNILVFIRQGTEYAYLYLSRQLTQRIFKVFSLKMIRNYLSLPYMNFVAHHRSTKIKYCTATSLEGANSFHNVLNLISASITILLLGGAILYKSPKFSICILVLVGLLVAINKRFINKKTKKAYQTYNRVQKLYFQKIYSVLNLSRELTIFNSKEYFIEEIDRDLSLLSQVNTRISIYPQISRLVMEVILSFVMTVVVVIVSFNNSFSSKSLIADIVTIAVLGRRILPSLNQLFANYTDLFGSWMQIKIITREIEPVYHQKMSVITDADRKELLALSAIEFSYKNQHELFDQRSMSVYPGDRIALMGETGRGKSTFMMIAAGIIRPSSGKVSIHAHLFSLATPLAYVSQQVELLSGTVLENISFGNPVIDIELAWRVLNIVCLRDHINSLPQSIDTQIGDNGVKFSGGQRQRLGIARALYARPSILFLDEATSALDEETETSLMNNLNTFMTDGAVVFITHRQSNARLNSTSIYTI